MSKVEPSCLPDRVVVNPCGDPKSPYYFVAEAPGRQEHRQQVECNRGRKCRGKCVGHTLVGQTGQTLDVWLDKAGIPRSMFYLRNTVRHWPGLADDDGSKKPTPAEIKADLPDLLGQVSQYKPSVIIAAGTIAIQALLEGTEHASFGLESLNGRLCWTKDGTAVIPITHPAAGLHDPFASVQTWLGLVAAARYIREGGTEEEWFGPKLKRDYRVVQGVAEVKAALAKRQTYTGTYVDTEGLDHFNIDTLQFSPAPGCSYLIQADDVEGMTYFLVNALRPLTFHHAMHDLDGIEAYIAKHRIPVKLEPLKDYACTLVKTYVTARETAAGKTDSDEASVRGQGLKSLTYKYLGHRMTTWDELTHDPQRRITKRYLLDLWEDTLGPDKPAVVNQYAVQPGPDDVDITRNGDWGNPFPIIKAQRKHGIKGRTRLQAIAAYKKWIVGQPQLMDRLPELVGKRLACVCKPQKCHGDVLAQLVSELPGPLNPPVNGRAKKLGARLLSMLPKPDLYKKWITLLNGNPNWKALIESEYGPTPALKISDIPRDKFEVYAEEDPDFTGRLDLKLSTELDSKQLWGPYELDMAVVPMLRSMSATGLLVDKDKLLGIEAEAWAKSEKLGRTLKRMAWNKGMREFNPDSNDDVAKLVYGPYRAKVAMMTKSGSRPAVDEKALASLHLEGEAVQFREVLLDYKEVQKLLSTYIKPLWDYIGVDGRVHPQWRATVTVSGRLACQNPNLLAMPNRSKLGKRLMECFVAGPGNVLLNVDLSQIELRVAASESGDRTMIDAYLNGIDLHDLSIKNVLGLDPKSDEGKGQRVVAKMGNFSALYGITGQGLQTRLAAAGFQRSLDFCEDFIYGKRQEWPTAFAFLDEAAEECAVQGFVRDMWGRLRYLPMIWSPVERAQAEAARQAGNMKIQGGAQGVEKHGMKKWWAEVRLLLPKWRPLIQVHDAVMFEGPASELDKARKLTIDCFENAVADRFVIPIKADYKVGESWGTIH